jgi:hypothetical protein
MAEEQEAPQQTPAQTALAAWVDKRFKSLSRGRWAEEREWFQAGMFDQLKQWLESSGDGGKRLQPVKVDSSKKWPMPVTNHFSKTISTNANALGAAVPEMQGKSDNYDAKNRRAAEAAMNAIDAANEESGMNVLNPTLARQVVLWGLGITKDSVAFDHSTDEVPDIQTPEPQPGPDGQPMEQEPQVVGTQKVPSARLDTDLPTVFEVYLPRDCKDPNLTPIVIARPRLAIGKAKEKYPNYEEKFTGDDSEDKSGESLASFFHNSLRSLAYSSNVDPDAKMCTITEVWCDWSELDDDVQDAIEKEWAEPSQMYPNMSKAEAAIEFGLFAILYKNDVIEWGENPWDGDCEYTFFPWQKDVASPYPKGLPTELIPLQKQLNRLDSLMERALMSNAVVKLLWPTTQSTPAPTGDPVEITKWDPLGDGKVKPEYFGGKAYGTELMAKRAQIVADFEALGFTNAVAEGDMPSGAPAFRALAFASAKTEESRKTQRYLWEQAHTLRARKILKMAKKIWTTPRKIQTAGFNNRMGAKLLEAADLMGEYELDVVPDSSRPKTLTEKLEVLQTLQEAGMVDTTDPGVRVYITDELGVQDFDLADNLDYSKAERDLQVSLQGITPQANPYSNWPIHFKVFSQYTKTEEFEGLDPKTQAGVLAYTQWIQEIMNPPATNLGPGAPPPPGAPPTGTPPHATLPKPTQQQQAKGGVAGPSPSHVMGQTPGIQVSTPQVQRAAETEGFASIPHTSGAN